MKCISYQFQVTVPSVNDQQEPTTYLQDKSIICNDDKLDEHLALARKEAYGEVTVEDADPELYPEPTPTDTEVLNALLGVTT